MNLLFILLSGVVGLVLGILVMFGISKAGLNKDQQKAAQILEQADIQADAKVKQAILDGRTQVHELKIEAEKEIKERRQEITEMENKLLRREDNLNFRDETLAAKEKQIDRKSTQLSEKLASLDEKEKELQAKIDVQITELERVAAMSSTEAKEELFAAVEKRMEQETVAYIKDKEEEAKAKADDIARNIIALAIQRLSQDEAAERTVSVVSLPSEEMKGRIIGREGRNIKAIEQATGVDLIIDDTPEVVTISGFDAVRREVARLTIEKLVSDGRIHPARIEETVEKAQREVNSSRKEAGEQATFDVGIHNLHPELVKLLGRLKYRTSYGQNVLQHSVEVAHLAGLMASELGLDPKLAKRAGLLHDIGKSIDHEVEGSHVKLGAELCRKYKESAVVVNSVESHHGDVEPESLIACIVQAAETISAARPGARRETLETYTNRLKQLEEITDSFKGVDKSYAIQAGREVRVMVIPEQVNDDDMVLMARNISKKIEESMEYPGQIRVNVIRESRVTD